MSTRILTKRGETLPSTFLPTTFDDFLRPWNEWFNDENLMARNLNMPAVNIMETKDEFNVSLAVPGMKKEDFKIDVDGNMLTISCEKEEKKEEKEAKFTRKEYNYSSFSRSFTLPEGVNQEKIDAHYENGILKMALPKKEEVKRLISSKHISVK